MACVACVPLPMESTVSDKKARYWATSSDDGGRGKPMDANHQIALYTACLRLSNVRGVAGDFEEDALRVLADGLAEGFWAADVLRGRR